VTIEDTDSAGEHRYVTIGLDALAQLLVVVYATRGDTIRLISARRASAREIGDDERSL
jgi:uncharacterized DUF497 family protein